MRETDKKRKELLKFLFRISVREKELFIRKWGFLSAKIRYRPRTIISDFTKSKIQLLESGDTCKAIRGRSILI